ncbi:hypothetical protein FACS1894155_08050 [Bacteroidia bacterium]|nr:hypothetical protein FACS189455_1260 [Bacteroidia bacterium]GHU90123.1 hypothetical protein FACS1894155_08050 [Bacteroidia bacterium]
MRIFEIATGFTPIPAKIGAATEIVVQNLANNLSQKNEVILIDVQSKNREGIDCPIYEIGMPQWLMNPGSFLSIRHKLKRALYSVKLALRVKKIIREEPAGAVFHFHNQYNFAFTHWWCSSIKKKKTETRFVYTLHTPLWSESADKIRQSAKKKYFLEIYSIRHADRVIALNPNAGKNIRSYFKNKPDNIIVIPNGVNTEVYHPEPTLLKDKPLNFISVGSVCDRKNQLQTIQLLHPILTEKQSRFSFAGAIADSEYMKEIEQYIHNNHLENRITYLGEKSPGKDLNEIYNSGSIYISQSKSEAFSLVVLEAMSAGLPVLLSEDFRSSLQGTPPSEAIIFCKSNEDFYRVINSFYPDTKKLNELSSSARKYIEEHFSWKQIADLYEKALKQ